MHIRPLGALTFCVTSSALFFAIRHRVGAAKILRMLPNLRLGTLVGLALVLAAGESVLSALGNALHRLCLAPLAATCAAFLGTLRANIRLDRRLLAFLILFGTPLAVVSAVSTSTWQTLVWGGRKDEVPMVTALESMTVRPYGNSANYWNNPTQFPTYWRYVNYGYWVYAQGIYYDLAFLAFAPLKWLGAPTFPVAPLILRFLSLLSALTGLCLLYNYGKRYSGSFTALFAAGVWVTTNWILINAISIHPDAIQVMLTLLALHLAARHQREGDVGSLLALGVASGLQHSAKMGGIWLIPMALTAMVWGWRGAPDAVVRRPWRSLAGRALLLLGAAIAGFFLASPYTLVDWIYWRVLLASQAPAHTATVTGWARAVWSDQGWLLCSATLLALVYHLGRGLARRADRPMVLAALLGLGNLAWFFVLGRAEIRIEWVTPAFLPLALVLGDGLSRCLRAAAKFAGARRILVPLAAGIVCAIFIWERWFDYGNVALRYMILQCPVDYNTRALAPHAPAGSRVMVDVSGMALFDTRQYPDQLPHGTPKYWDLWHHAPDFFILSEFYLSDRFYQNLLQTQHHSVFNTEPFAVRLYQDLLIRPKEPFKVGPTGIPGIELVAILPTHYCCSISGFPKIPMPDLLTRHFPATAERIVTTYTLAAQIYSQISSTERTPAGYRLALYKLGPIGGPHGRMSPISSGHRECYAAEFAFDDATGSSCWQSSHLGADVQGKAYLGFDFGGGARRSVRKIALKWVAPAYTPAHLKVQCSDDGDLWTDIAAVTADRSGPALEQRISLPDVGPHRAWRILADAPLTAGVPIAVTDLRLLDDHDAQVE